MINIKSRDTYKKTELLLYRYKDFKKAIEEREEEIKDIMEMGAEVKLTSVIRVDNQKRYIFKFSEEEVEEKIKK